MIGIIMGFTGIMMAGVAIVYYAAAHAPAGHEDEQGFHYAPETRDSMGDVPVTAPVFTR